MKKRLNNTGWIALIIGLCVSATFLPCAVCAEDAGITVIGDGSISTGGDMEPGETIEIEKVCDITLLGYVTDKYAMSVAAYERDENERFLTPEADVNDTEKYHASSWGSYERYKFKVNEEQKSSYAEMYCDIGVAIQSSTYEYLLLDIRMDVLNKSVTAIDVQERFDAKLVYDEDYEFELTDVRMETTDTLGNENEWLVEATEIPMLVERTVHFIFEIPKIVATDTQPLMATFTVADQDYEIVLR